MISESDKCYEKKLFASLDQLIRKGLSIKVAIERNPKWPKKEASQGKEDGGREY